MKTARSQLSWDWIGVEGALMVLAPFPVMLAGLSDADLSPSSWSLTVAGVAALACFCGAFALFRYPRLGQSLVALALTGSCAIAGPRLADSPFAALLGATAVIAAIYALLDFKPGRERYRSWESLVLGSRQEWWATAATLGLLIFSAIARPAARFPFEAALAASAFIGQALLFRWIWRRQHGVYRLGVLTLSASILVSIAAAPWTEHVRAATSSGILLAFLILLRAERPREHGERWWIALLNHPARLLLSGFFALCVIGTLLLMAPDATGEGGVAPIDAAFTSVSAVCVTGLIVLDTPNAFTFLGQFFILALIQLGGLGIMCVATIALRSIGRRLTLRQEHLLTTMAETDYKDVIDSLIVILKFTFAAEGLGALALSILFCAADSGPWWQAVWRGIFTSISAFCNAGFALRSDNLVAYQSRPLVLHVVAALIIAGGMAPATALALPNWLARRPIPVAARIALIVTVVLLFAGTFFFLAFEWSGALKGLSVADKLHNAWFQSVTTRTAGFNSVDIANLTGPSYLVMLCLMFIGGCPGGTAGGVKTTTVGVLIVTFWANIANRDGVIFRNRRISPETIERAITIVISGAIVWLAAVFALEATQRIASREIVFEITSALGTVGLSIGATARLDEIGKIIVMLTMFAGRVGPMTLLMLLSENRPSGDASCHPDAKIPLT